MATWEGTIIKGLFIQSNGRSDSNRLVEAKTFYTLTQLWCKGKSMNLQLFAFI